MSLGRPTAGGDRRRIAGGAPDRARSRRSGARDPRVGPGRRETHVGREACLEHLLAAIEATARAEAHADRSAGTLVADISFSERGPIARHPFPRTRPRV